MGETLAKQDNRLRKVFLKVRESGLKLNKDKFQFRKNSIVFLGHIISSEGIRVYPSKTEFTELQRFLGMVNYPGKFIPNLAEVTAPLRALLKKDVVLNLQKPQLDAIEKLKTFITSLPFKNFRSKLTNKIKNRCNF